MSSGPSFIPPAAAAVSGAAPPTIAQLQFELSEAGKLYSTVVHQVDVLKSAYNDLQSSHSALQAHTISLQSSLTSSLDAHRALEADYQQRYTQYTNTLQAKDKELSTLLASHIPPHSVDLLKAELTEEVAGPWRERLCDLHSRLSDSQRNLAVSEKDRAVMKVELEGTISLMKQLHARQLAEAEARLAEARAAASGVGSGVAELRAAQQKVEALERDNGELLLRLKKATEDVASSRDAVERSDDAQRRAQAEWDSDRAALQGRAALTERQVELGRVREEEMQAEVSRLRRDLVELTAKRAAAEEEVTEMREEGRRRDVEVACLRDLFERKVKDRDAAEEERDRAHRALTDELYEQLRRLQGEKEELRKKAGEAHDALLRAIKRHAEEAEDRKRREGERTPPNPAAPTPPPPVDGEVARLREALVTAQRQVKTVIEERQRVVLKWEELAMERERERKEEGEKGAEYASLQVRYREVKEREGEWRERMEAMRVELGLVQAERDDVRREREEERRMFIASRDQLHSAWRQEKALLLQRLAQSGGGAQVAPSAGGGEGKYKVMCVALRDKLGALMAECERDRQEWERRLKRKELELEEAERRLQDSERFREELHRQMKLGPNISLHAQ